MPDPIKAEEVLGPGPVNKDFLRELAKEVEVTPVSNLQSSNRSTIEAAQFDPTDKYYEYIDNPTPYTTDVDKISNSKQSALATTGRAFNQFLSGVGSGLSQGIINLLDVSSYGNEDYNSSIMGLSTKEISDWQQRVSENNKIFEKEPGKFSPGDPAWWANQVGSAGTGVGMAIGALAETALIEGATGGLGTGAAIGRLGNLFTKLRKGAQGGEILAESLNAAKGLRSAATVYGVMNRVGESRMEALQSYNDIYNELSEKKKEDGTPLYSDDEAKRLASEGADVTWRWNMALVPLDILSYRAMVFNPISGSATGAMEKGLEKVAGVFGKSAIGKAAGWTTAKAIGVIPEGLEEGFQFIGSEEGKHYAEVLGGIGDSSSFSDRFGEDVRKDEFWNNFAGGIIGAPVIGGVMNATNKIMSGRRQAAIDDMHKSYIENVGRMDTDLIKKIKTLEDSGDIEGASNLRRQYGSNKALAYLHMDAMADKDTAFSSYTNFLNTTLEEINEGKLDALQDLGINIDPSNVDQVNKIKEDFTQYSKDAEDMQKIYGAAKNYYNKNILPSVVSNKFNIDKTFRELVAVENSAATELQVIPEYNQMSPQGKTLFEIKTEMPSLQAHVNGLEALVAVTENEQEKESYTKVLKQTQAKLDAYANQLQELNIDENYLPEQREVDQDLTESALGTQVYAGMVHEKNKLNTQLALARKQAALYNNRNYVKEKLRKVVDHGSKVQMAQAVESNPDDPVLREAAQAKITKINSDEALARTPAGPTEPVQLGNDDIFGVSDEAKAGLNAIGDIISPKDDSIPFQGFVDDEVVTGEAGFMSPKAIRDLSPRDLQTLADGVDTAMNNLPAEQQTFKDLLKLYAKVRGKEDADKAFNGLVKGWEASGRAPENYDAAYNGMFNNLEDAFGNISSVVDANEVVAETDKLEEEVITENIPAGYDTNGQPEYESEESPVGPAKPIYSTLAFTNTLGKWKVITAENGSTSVEYVQNSDDLIFGQYIDSRKLLDPDKFREGTSIYARIPENFRDILVPVFDPSTGEKTTAIPFGQWAAENNIEEGSEGWINKIPIIVYEQENPTSEDKGVAFIHDSDWYHIFNQHGSTPAVSIQKQKETQRIRKAVKPGKATSMRVTFKTETTVKDLRIPDGKTIPISQGNPQTVLVKFRNGVPTREGKIPVFNSGEKMIRDEDQAPTKDGQYYGAVRYGMKDGKPSYLQQTIFPQTIGQSQEIVNTIKNFAQLFVNPGLGETAIRDIREKTGIDILDQRAQGALNFLKQYITIADTNRVASPQEVKNQIDNGKNNIPQNGKYVVVTAVNTIVFGVKGGDVKKIKTIEDAVEFSNFVKDMPHNISDAAIRAGLANPKNQAVTIAKPKGGNFVVTAVGTYDQYIKTKINTNLKSINIGTEESPNYVSQVQPSIGIALEEDYKIPTVTAEATNKEVSQEVKPVEVPAQTPVNTEADLLLKDALDLMGGTPIQEEYYSPKTLTEADRVEMANSIDRIAGLSPFEQEKVKNFMYQHAVEGIKNDTLTPEGLQKTIKELFDGTFKPIREASIERSTTIKSFLQANSNLDQNKINDLIIAYKSLDLQAKKIDDILGNFNTFYKVVNDEIEKNQLITGNVTQKNIEDDIEDDENRDSSDIDQDTPSQQDFTTDSLRINPDLKITPKLRLLFEGIRNFDKNGTTKTVFGLPDYINSGEILRYLQLNLVNTPARFSDIISKLEKYKDARTWLPEVINKLKSADTQTKMSAVRAFTNSPLKPRFSMFSYNKKTSWWSVKMYDSHLNGVEGVILDEWKNSFLAFSGVVEYSGNKYVVNDNKRKEIMKDFEELGSLDNSEKSEERILEVLSKVGIELTSQTLKKIKAEGLRANYETKTWKQLFTDSDGLFKIIQKELSIFTDKDIVDGKTPLSNSLFKVLAKEESAYTTKYNSLNFRENSKSFFGLVMPKFITDAQVDITREKSALRARLSIAEYSKDSFILKLLNNSPKFREQHSIDNVSDAAIKQYGKTSYGDTSMTALSPFDHEATKLGGFWFNQQGNVEYDTVSGAKSGMYPGTNIPLRIATMLVPTMSDKSMAMWAKTAVLDLKDYDLMNGNGITEELSNVLYEQLVKPDLNRMIASSNNPSGISGYEKGKKLFMTLSSLNEVMFDDTILLVDHVALNGGNKGLTINDIEANKPLMDKIRAEISKVVIDQRDKKVGEWVNIGLIPTVSGQYSLNRIDSKYINKYTTKGLDNRSVVNMSAMDFTINSLIHNANMQMIYTGDPAQYFKSKKVGYQEQVMDTYDNMNKRLANLIAPAIPYPDGVDEKYVQVFMEDQESIPDSPFLKFLTRISDGRTITDEEIESLRGSDEDMKREISGKYPKASAFFKIEGTDAQEYTTWKEHLNILQRYGNMSDSTLGITQKEIEEARKIFTSNISRESITPAQMEIISKVMQPIKPRYVGYYDQGGIQRMMYIKTSSFPLIPQLTQGFEIDKLRKILEDKESEGLNVRASYQSGNKVGSPTNPLKVWNKDGTFNSGAKITEANSLALPRSGWGIQQDVPFKSDKAEEDKVRLGTQLMKLIFGDGIMNLDGFKFEGKPFTGKEMQQKYTDLFTEMLDLRQTNFNKKLKLGENGEIVDSYRTAKRLQKMLKKEAVRRGYPLNDIVGLGLDSEGNFNLPLWASSNANRYESLLNSLVNNALVKIKMPGYSYVAGSSEGFRSPQVITEGEYTNSEIIYTKHWNGNKLQMTHSAEGEMKRAQVFLPSKFKGKDGKLIDLFSKKSGDYIYVTKEGNSWKLKDGVIDDELLNLLSFRIPTSSIGSAANIEIAGFIPSNSGDLIIVPSEFTKQKGMDFDVDKEYTYHYWHTVDGDSGRIRKVDNLYTGDSIDEIYADLETLRTETMKEAAKVKSLSEQLEEVEYSEESENPIMLGRAKSLREKLSNSKSPAVLQEVLKSTLEEMSTLESHKEKIIQNRIIDLMQSVMANPSDKVQAKINKALSLDYEREQAEIIKEASFKGDPLFTGVSDIYQKEQFFNGVSGKIGTGAYSLDVVFHSLVQQSALNGNPVTLKEMYIDIDGKMASRNKIWKFGDQSTYSVLGNQNTVDGRRSITDVISGRQNASVDNGKEKILGIINLNKHTMDVDKVMSLTGMDINLSNAFLSQPILRDYVEMIQNSKSILADFVEDREKEVMNALVSKYYPEGVTEIVDEDFWEVMSKDMSPQRLRDELISKTPTGRLQFAVLLRFLEMKEYGESIRAVQVAINTDSKGLDKSFFNVIEKLNTVANINNPTIRGASKLVGEYVVPDETTNEEALINIGYKKLPGDVFVKPNTISGKISVNSLTTAYNLYKHYLPYDSNRMNMLFDEILPVIQGENATETNNVILKQEVLRGMKKYLSAIPGNGVISVDENIKSYRDSLYFDKDGNTSLASYIKQLMNHKGDPIVDKFIKTNTLLRRLEPKVEIDGSPSIIKYNNAVGEDFNEQELYNSFAYLGAYNRELPKIGNKQYTTTTLMQAMVDYSLLGNAIQEAVQFTKFIPSKYYDIVGYTQYMKNVHTALVTNTDNDNIFGFNELMPSKFTTQYIQHNPGRVKYKLPGKNYELLKRIVPGPGYKNKLENLSSFQLKSEDTPSFITIYNNQLDGKEKQQLYVKYGGQYIRIPVLGTFAFDEYDPSTNIAETSVNDKFKLVMPENTESIVPSEDESTPTDIFETSSGNLRTIIESIGKMEESATGAVAKALVDVIPNIPIEFSDSLEAKGRYYRDNNFIQISEKLRETGMEAILSETIVHETIHALTVPPLKQYLKEVSPGVYELQEGAPEYVSQLLLTYNVARREFSKEDMESMEEAYRTRTPMSDKQLLAYGVRNIYEFVAGMLSNREFQNKFKSTPFMSSGKTIWDKFVEVLNSLLKDLGVNFDSEGLTASAVKASLELIQEENKQNQTNPSKSILEEASEIPNDMLDDETIRRLNMEDDFDPLNPGEESGFMSPTDKVTQYINNLQENQIKCN